MVNILKYEGKNEQELIEQILTELKCQKDDLYIKTEFIEGKLFKSSKYIIKVVKKEEINKYIEEFIKNIGNLMDINIEIEILEQNGSFNITLISNNNSILIGKNGKTLLSIQTLLRQSIRNKFELNIKINLDIANYKIKKLKNIERLVKDIAKEVEKTKMDISLDSMNSYERRFVHNLINEYPNLTTESSGEGKDRHITIKYKEN